MPTFANSPSRSFPVILIWGWPLFPARCLADALLQAAFSGYWFVHWKSHPLSPYQSRAMPRLLCFTAFYWICLGNGWFQRPKMESSSWANRSFPQLGFRLSSRMLLWVWGWLTENLQYRLIPPYREQRHSPHPISFRGPLTPLGVVWLQSWNSQLPQSQ